MSLGAGLHVLKPEMATVPFLLGFNFFRWFFSAQLLHMTSDNEEPKMKVSQFFDTNPMMLVSSRSDIVFSDSLFDGSHFSESLFFGFSKHFFLTSYSKSSVPPIIRTISNLVDA